MATQYFEHKLELGNFSEQPHFILMEWHPSLNILAVGSVNVGTNIFFYSEDVRKTKIEGHSTDFSFVSFSYFRVNMMKELEFNIRAVLSVWLGIQ